MGCSGSGRTYVAYFAGGDDIVKCPHDLVARYVAVESVDLEDVNLVSFRVCIGGVRNKGQQHEAGPVRCYNYVGTETLN